MSEYIDECARCKRPLKRYNRMKLIMMREDDWGFRSDSFTYYYCPDCALEIKKAVQGGERVAELEDENAALKRELKITQGNLTLTLNNWEQAKGKMRREKEELTRRRKALDERDAQTPDKRARVRIAALESQRDEARAQCEEYRAKLGGVVDAIRAAADEVM